MQSVPVRNLMVTLGLLAASCCAQAATNIPFLERQLAVAKAVKIPIPTGFSPACDEDPQLAKRLTALTPKSSLFLTCFLDEKKWKRIREEKSRDIHPIIVIAVQAPLPQGPFSPEEFEKLRTAAHKHLDHRFQDTASLQRLRKDQERRLSNIGVEISIKDDPIRLQGFFTPAGQTSSFSFVVSGSSVVSENGTTRQVSEVQANTTIYYMGNVLGFLVVDNASEDDQGRTVREITSNWLQAYRDLNEVPTPQQKGR